MSLTSEQNNNWFPEYRLAHDGYEEFDDCPLCYKPADNFAGIHSVCEDMERGWSDQNEGVFQVS